MRLQHSDHRRKTIVYAAAAVASTSLLSTTALSETPPTTPNTAANTNHIHETLWGNPEVWEGETHAVDPTTILNIARGGTDEFHPKHNNNNNKDKSKKSKKKRTSKKEKAPKQKEDNEEDKDEEENDKKPTTATTNPMMEEILQQDDYYDILGLPRGEDNIARIKKAYRRRAVQTHPDKTGGDRRAFDKLAEAYEVLLDDDKRALYDRYGKAGLDPTRGPPGGAEDLFRSFFGGGPASQRAPPVNRTVRYQLEVTLEELYRGTTKTVTVEAPRGLDFNFYSQFQPQASKKKQVQVMIPRGAHPGQAIVLSGEMDFDSKDSPPGDLIFQLQVRKHREFTRKGHDLAKEVTISLQEAICGCTRRFRHLNGKYITIESAKLPHKLSDLESLSEAGEGDADNTEAELEPDTAKAANIYIQSGDVQVLKGQGMPKNPHGTEFGDLYIQYNVELPKVGATDNLTPSERIELARLLGKLEGKETPSSTNSHVNKGKSYVLQPARISDFGRASGPVPDMENDHHDPLGDDHRQHPQFPFAGMGHRQFFFSSSGRSPFFGQENNFDDDENVQCRQM